MQDSEEAWKMSNSVFQSVMIQLREISDHTFGVIDTEGTVVSCTDMSLLGERWAPCLACTVFYF